MIGFFFTMTILVFIAVGIIWWIVWSIKTALTGASDAVEAIAEKRRQQGSK